VLTALSLEHGVKALEPDPVAMAQTIVRTFFPELWGKHYQMMVFWSDPFDRRWSTIELTRNFGLEVQKSVQDFLKGDTRETVGIGLLNSYCEFDQYGDLVEMSIHGRINQHLQNAALRDSVDAHPDWSNAQVAEALEREGARYGPSARASFLRMLPSPQQLAAAFKSEVMLGEVAFELRADVEPVAARNAYLHWRVELFTHLTQQNGRVKYVATFEPLGGKLQSILRAYDAPQP